jgi:hypothetical protein
MFIGIDYHPSFQPMHILWKKLGNMPGSFTRPHLPIGHAQTGYPNGRRAYRVEPEDPVQTLQSSSNRVRYNWVH